MKIPSLTRFLYSLWITIFCIAVLASSSRQPIIYPLEVPPTTNAIPPTNTPNPSATATFLPATHQTCARLPEEANTSQPDDPLCDPDSDMMRTLRSALATAEGTETQRAVNLALPTIQIPISTFDINHSVTRTPAPPARCPAYNPDLSPDQALKLGNYPTREENEKDLLDFMNAGGVQALLHAEETDTNPDRFIRSMQSADLTGDGKPEYIITARTAIPPLLYVIGCQQGKYQIDAAISSSDSGPEVFGIRDMNFDGIPELIVHGVTCHQCDAYSIYEWDGQTMQSMVRNWTVNREDHTLDYDDTVSLIGSSTGKIEDIDQNGTYEFILTGGRPSNISDSIEYGPYRDTILVYMWDGHYFTRYSSSYAPAEYRYQALQDADDAFIEKDYPKALSLYQDVIFSDLLKSWSKAVQHQLLEQRFDSLDRTPTPPPLPADAVEYNQLSTYAMFRIVLLHLAEGHVTDAKLVYKNLIQDYPQDKAGYPYVEMATAFWKDYLVSQSLPQACAQAVQYATQHPMILTPLESGDTMHLWSREYQPEDVCPIQN